MCWSVRCASRNAPSGGRRLEYVSGVFRLAALSVLCAATLTATSPAADAAPSSTDPATDGQGFIDSSARCTGSDVAVALASTANSKVAICKSAAGKYEYRGVRLRDAAKSVLPATANSSGGFVATSDGITYTLTSKSLDISDGTKLIRSEPVVYFHGNTGAAPAAAPSGAPASAPATPVTGAPTAAPTTPLPPPLPAEVGGKTGSR